MKKYLSGFLFFFCMTLSGLIGLFLLTGNSKEESKHVQAIESVEQPIFAEKSGEIEKTETGLHLVLNQESIEAKVINGKYCLVSEGGYLLVYDELEENIQLVTHIPVADFPESEQEKLMEGIWFSTMAELFSYLESYSS